MASTDNKTPTAQAAPKDPMTQLQEALGSVLGPQGAAVVMALIEAITKGGPITVTMTLPASSALAGASSSTTDTALSDPSTSPTGTALAGYTQSTTSTASAEPSQSTTKVAAIEITRSTTGVNIDVKFDKVDKVGTDQE
jgi:hypothetical protein